MIGLDTNVLVRYIAQDDAVQADKANQLMATLNEDNRGFISVVTLVELVWVLKSCFKADHANLVAVLERIASAPSLMLENEIVVRTAVRSFSTNSIDFADHLIAHCGLWAGCLHSVTFDRQAATLPGMRLL